MKLNLKYLCVSFLIFVSGMAFSQDEGSYVLDVEYELDLQASAKIRGSAVLTMQDKAYEMKGNGIEIYCDGSSVWVLDSKIKEAYIEAVTPEISAYTGRAALELSGMKPGSETVFELEDGRKVRVRVNSIKKSDRKDISSFRPTDFDSSWIVTDLR